MSIAEAKQVVRIEEVVARRLPLRREGGHFVGKCPFHEDGGRPNLAVFPSKQNFHCFACGAHGDAVDFIARMDGTSLAEAAERVLKEQANAPKAPPPFRPKERPIDLGRTSAAYSSLLRYLDLAPEDREGLLKRGLSPGTIARRGYRTLTAADRRVLAVLVQMDLGPDALSGVPGFFLADDGRWELAGAPGILIPVTDHGGSILGIQIRATTPGQGRYRWLSSAGKPSGTSPGAPCHTASGRKPPDVVWVTEGPLKADVVAEKVGVTTLGVTGVTTWRRVPPLVKACKARRAILAFDRDESPKTAEVVGRNVEQLRHALVEMGVEVLFASWSGAKGVDDALLAEKRIKIGRERP